MFEVNQMVTLKECPAIIKLECGKTYLTAGGYAVKIMQPVSGSCYATFETSPGVNTSGQNITHVRTYCPLLLNGLMLGWCYDADGTIPLGSEWTEKLRIIKELPEGIPTLPKEFTWAGGYPQYRVPLEGEEFMGLKNDGSQGGYVATMKYQSLVGASHQRFIVEKKKEKEEVEIAQTPNNVPNGFVNVTNIDDYTITKGDGYLYNSGTRNFHLYDMSIGKKINHLSLMGVGSKTWTDWATKENYENYQKGLVQKSSSTDVTKCPDTHIDVSDHKDYVTKNTDIFLRNGGKRFAPCGGGYTVSVCKNVKIFALKENYEEYKKLLKEKTEAIQAGVSSPADVTKVTDTVNEEETEMSEALKFETVKNVGMSTAKFGGRLAWKAANYFVFDVVKSITVKAMRTARYIMFAGATCGGIYAYNYPESAVDTLYKCLPKISISVDAPEILKG